MASAKSMARRGCESDNPVEDGSLKNGAASSPSRPYPRRKGAALWYVPLEVGEHQIDHAEFPPELVGCYVMLVWYQWRRGAIPADPSKLARICRLSLAVWRRRIAPSLLPLFEVRGEFLVEPHYEAVRERVNAISGERRNAARERWRRDKRAGLPQASGSERHEINENNGAADANASGLHAGVPVPPPLPAARPLRAVQPSAPLPAASRDPASAPRRSRAAAATDQPCLAMGPVLVRLPASAAPSVSPPSAGPGKAPDAGQAAPDACKAPDARKVLYTEGLQSLMRLTGKMEGQARPLLGKLAKQAKDDCAGLLAILRDAERQRPVDPVPWVIRCIEQRSAPKPSRGVLGMLVAERRANAAAQPLTIDADPAADSLARMHAHG